MENIKALYVRVAQLRQAVVKIREEAERATLNSFKHGSIKDRGFATDEASKATRLVHEIGLLETRVIAAEQQIIDAEHHILKLNQQEALLREENMRHTAYIDQATKLKLEDVARQVRALRG